jgi:hypothetical protein
MLDNELAHPVDASLHRVLPWVKWCAVTKVGSPGQRPGISVPAKAMRPMWTDEGHPRLVVASKPPEPVTKETAMWARWRGDRDATPACQPGSVATT